MKGGFVAGIRFIASNPLLRGVVLLVTGRAGRKTGIPFGPWMLAGAFVGIVAGEAVGQWYLGIL